MKLSPETFMKASGTVTPPASGVLLIEYRCDTVEKLQSIIIWRTTEIFPRRPFEVSPKNPWAKPILCTKMVVTHGPKVLDCTVCPRRKDPTFMQQKENCSCASSLHIKTKTEQENATEMHMWKKTRSSTKDMERETIKFLTDNTAITTLQYNPPGYVESQMERQGHVDITKKWQKLCWQERGKNIELFDKIFSRTCENVIVIRIHVMLPRGQN